MKFTIAIASIFAISQAGDSGIDEAQNALGSNQCWYSYECDGEICHDWGWCHGEANFDITLDPLEQLRLYGEGLELDIIDLTNEVNQMRDAFRQVTQIMHGEFN